MSGALIQQNMPTLGASAGPGLDYLLHPMKAAEFYRDFWESHTWMLERKRADYYRQLLEIADIDTLITLGCRPNSPSKIRLVKSQNDDLAARHPSQTAEGQPDIYQVYRAYADDGYTISMDRLDLIWGPLAGLCRNLEHAFHHPVAINSYLTPAGAQGFPPHFDTHDVFILQVAGSKTWHLYRSPTTLPLPETSSAGKRDSFGPVTRTVLLREGDLLYLPRGVVHEAFTSERRSLHLTVGVHVFRWIDLVREAVTAAGDRDERLRMALPVGFLDQDEELPVLIEGLGALLPRLIDEADARQAVDRLAQRLLTNGQPVPDGHFESLERLPTLGLSTVVKVRDGMPARLRAAEGRTCLQFPGNVIAGPVELTPILRSILVRQRFAVRELSDALSDADKLTLIHSLVREGLLAIEREEAS